MTTNAFVKEKSIGFNSNKKDTNCFPKEFINRIDEVIEFNDANLDSVKKMINNKINNYNLKYNTSLSLTPEEISIIINNSDYNNFGYRKLDRLIKKELDNKIIKTIL